MKKLTDNQNEIINQLVKEFEKINSEVVATGSLINIGAIKGNVQERKNFLAECNAERVAFSRMVDKQVKSDIEKLRADLNSLGMDIECKNDGLCVSSFHIVLKSNRKQLEYISYDPATYVDREKLGESARIYKSVKIGIKDNSSFQGRAFFKSIEELAKSNLFQKRLENYYKEYSA